jgi:hypothetical protein
MGKQRNKQATKENSVEDVNKDEQLPASEENTEQQEMGTDTDGTLGRETGVEGPAGDNGSDNADDSDNGEEPPASAPEEPEAPAPVAPVVDTTVTTLTQLVEATPAPTINAEAKSNHADAIIAYIGEYVVAMDPTKYQDAKTGVPRQKRLYTLISELARLEFLDFKVGMDKLLKLIFDYRHAAFSDLYSRRFFENLYPQMTHEQVREFDDLLSILVTVGSATNRSRAMTQVDLAAALKSVKNPKAQQNLSAYFSALR